jgi:hypothetical protein
VTSSFPIWGCVLKGCFERGIFGRAKSRLKAIEDYNLERWCLNLCLWRRHVCLDSSMRRVWISRRRF